MKTLPAQHLRDSDFQSIEHQLTAIFYQVIFKPVMEILERDRQALENAGGEDALKKALRSGRVQYSDGVFSGQFSSKITLALREIGAKYQASSKTFKISAATVPGWVLAEAGAYSLKARATHDAIIKVLDATQRNLPSVITIDPDDAVDRVARGFEQKAGELAAFIPELTEQAKGRLEADYTKNMALWIQKWNTEAITDLRGRVEENASQGYRFDKLREIVADRYGVSQSKAKFLAMQETSLFMSKFRQQRFQQIGITHYRWRTSNDVRVRPDHRKLNGRIFAYAQPPITDSATGARNNPGEDFGPCRCNDEAIVPEDLKRQRAMGEGPHAGVAMP